MGEGQSRSTAADRDVQEGNEAAGSAQLDVALKLVGLAFTDAERRLMLEGVSKHRDVYEQLRSVELANNNMPALRFDPRPNACPPVMPRRRPLTSSPTPLPRRPDDLEDLALLPVTDLSQLVRTQQVSAIELTRMYLTRLRRLGPRLECVVTVTEELATEQARRADAEIAAGLYRGPLHGIPWGAKDLLATRGIPTTWGAPPYQDQVFDSNATVVERLADAGAVLIAKLTMGSLAWGDVWFGGKTRSPWNLDEGSSGSSAGSGAATAAGLVGFSIGTETHGSIVSPSTQCGVTGLRPTFGRVSRHGAMALCWSLDKIGPMCRSVEDCALVFDAIRGPDGHDPTVIDAPFEWPAPVELRNLRVGYVRQEFERERETKDHDAETLRVLRESGVDLIPVDLPDYPLDALEIILWAEAAAAFDDLTRSDRDDLLVRQGEDSWPNRFRVARLIPAVEYIQANRVRLLVMQAMARLMDQVDVYVAPSMESRNLWLTNATGHPAVVVPNGWRANGLPTTITFTGRLFDEQTVLAVAKRYQDATTFHRQVPPIA